MRRQRRPKGPYEHSGDNARREATAPLDPCEPAPPLYPALDPFDRAHDRQDAFGLLLPSAWEDEWGNVHLDTNVPSRPRLYPASHFVVLRREGVSGPITGGHTFEEAFHDHHERVRRLAAAGIRLGGGRPTSRGSGQDGLYGLRGVALRDLIEPRTRIAARGRGEQARLALEQDLEARADAILDAAAPDREAPC